MSNNKYSYLSQILRSKDIDHRVHKDICLKTGLSRWRNEEDFKMEDPFYYEAIMHVVNEKTISYNRYFYKISFFLECFMCSNLEFLDAVFDKHPLPPPGSGWRAIKRFLGKVDEEFRIRCSEYKSMIEEKHLPLLNQLGTILDGPELADYIWQHNLCLRAHNPETWSKEKQAWIVTPEGEFCDINLTPQDQDLSLDGRGPEWACYEIQGQGNDWKTEKQIEVFLMKQATCPYWAKLHWWSEEEMREYKKTKKKSQ